MKALEIYKKSNWGNVLVYPACEDAKTFTTLLGKKTFHEQDIKYIRRLGYTFKEVLPVFEGDNENYS